MINHNSPLYLAMRRFRRHKLAIFRAGDDRAAI